MKFKKIILIANNEQSSPLLKSQLIDLYSTPKLQKKEMHLLCDIEEGYNTENFITHTNFKNNFIAKRIFKLKQVLNQITQKDFENTIFHIRGFVSGILFYLIYFNKLSKINYIYDPRGAFLIEAEEKGSKISYLSVPLKLIEKHLIKNSIKTIVTSIRFKDLFIKEYGDINAKKFEVLYNSSSIVSNDLNKKDFRKDKVNVCYMGSINYWHNLDEIERLLKYLKSIIPKMEIHFYSSLKKKEQVLSLFDFPITYDFLPYHEIKTKINEMDICISIVKPTVSTKIASPIKISDYVCANKYIIANSEIGDFDDFFIKNKSAILFKYEQPFTFTLDDLESININANKELKKILYVSKNQSTILEILNSH